MKINLDPYLQMELTLITRLFESKGWTTEDEHAVRKKFDGKEIYLVFYPELLSYEYTYTPGDSSNDSKTVSEYHRIPWIACRMEFEGEEVKDHEKYLTAVKEWVDKNIPLKPFYDEDATYGIYAKKCSPYSRDWTQYIFYLNPDFPDGWWQNHALG